MQARILISGFVQGIGFRHFIKSKADELGLTGWARNLPDGRVEAILQGEKEKIEKAVESFKKGPFLAEVEEIKVIWEKSKVIYKDFKIL